MDELGRTPLHNAAQARKADFIQDLLAAGADVNATDWLDRTPLHEVADWKQPVAPDATDVNRMEMDPFADDEEAFSALLEAGADVDARDVRGNTPLHLTWRTLPIGYGPHDVGAAGGVILKAARKLLEAGADPLARNDRGVAADPASCRNWHSQVFARAAVPQEVYDPFSVDPRSRPVLADYAACASEGADVAARDPGGHTVLHHAAVYADTSVIALLLGAGADAGARSHNGTTVLHIAASTGNTAVATALLARGADVNTTDNGGSTPLHLAARNGNLATVHALLEAGADVNVTDAYGTPLHVPRTSESRLAIVDALLEAGMDVNTVEEEYGGALLMESFGGLWEGISAQLALRFLRAGADPDARNRSGGTVLHEAFQSGPDIYRMLLDAGANPGLVDAWGKSPLHLVAGSRESGVIPMLVRAGADVDLLNGDGEAPLHVAIQHYMENVARVAELLETGADPSPRTKEGDTPLHLAAGAAPWPDSSIVSVVEILVAAGADVNALNERGESPVVLAWLAGRSAVVDQLVAMGAEPVEPVAEPVTPGAEPAAPGAEPAAPGRVGELQTLLCDWSAGDYANRGSPFVFPAESVAGCLAAGTSLEVPDLYGQPPLFWLPAGNPEVFALLLETGVDVRERDDSGNTPLHASGFAVARALVEAGADPNAKGWQDRTPLHVAAERGAIDVLSFLVQAGADANARADGGQTPLHLALNSPVAAIRLLELGADPALRDDSGRIADPTNCENFGARSYFALADGDLVAECTETVTRQSGDVPLESALHVAAGAARDPGVIRALLEGGAPLNGRDGAGQLPLHRAAETGTPAVIRALLDAGADPNRRVEVFEALNPWEPRDWTPLHLAARNPDAAAVALLLDAGANVNARVDGYETPLHIAATNENADVAATLLEAGAGVDARNNEGMTPLHKAAHENPNPAVPTVLIEAGADLEARAMRRLGHTLRGLTPMYFAARGNGNPDIVEVLAEAGANVDAERAELRPHTPFMFGGTKGGPRNYGDLGHNSPLHLAALFNSEPAVLEALVRSGADLELRSRSGQTALHIAARYNPVAFPALLALGADTGVVDDEGRTPMDYASLNKTLHGLEEVRRLLGVR